MILVDPHLCRDFNIIFTIVDHSFPFLISSIAFLNENNGRTGCDAAQGCIFNLSSPTQGLTISNLKIAVI